MRSPACKFFSGLASLGVLLAAPAFAQEPDYLDCPLSLAYAPSHVVAQDLNGDTFPDFAAVEPGKTAVRIVLADPDAFLIGACQGVQTSSVDTVRTLVDLAVTDLDGDRDADIVVAEDRGARVLVNDGSGSFTVRNHIDLAADPTTIVAGNFDLEFPADVAVGATGGNIILLYGVQSTGLPSATARIQPPLSISVDTLTASDLNNDGRLDLLVLSQDPPAYQVLLRDGDDFRRLDSVSLGTTPTAVAVAKFDSDDVRDLAVTFANNQLTIFLGSLSPDPEDSSRTNVTYSAGNTVSTGNGPVSVAAGLLDGDLTVDAVVANETDHTVSILLNDGSGSLTQSNDLCADGSCTVDTGPDPGPLAVTLASLDADILQDVVAGTSFGLGFLFSSNPDPTPSPTPADTATVTPTSSPTTTRTPTDTPTDTPTATPTPSITRTVTATRTFTIIPTKTCPPNGGICVQGDSCAVIVGTGGSSSSPLAPLLIAAAFALMRWRSRKSRSRRA